MTAIARAEQKGAPPMNNTEAAQLWQRHLVPRWPNAANWDDDQITVLADELKPYPSAVASEAVRNLTRKGTDYLTIPALVAECADLMTSPSVHVSTRLDPARCPHPTVAVTAYVSDDPADPDYYTPAERWCAVCLTELPNTPPKPPPFQPDRRLIGHMEKGNP